jgi:hypothetical protein
MYAYNVPWRRSEAWGFEAEGISNATAIWEGRLPAEDSELKLRRPAFAHVAVGR